MEPEKIQVKHATIFQVNLYCWMSATTSGNDQLIASIQSDGLPPVISMIRGSAQKTVEDIGR